MSEVFSNIFYRLQNRCSEFSDILDRANPGKGDWQIVAQQPESKLNRRQCDEFLRGSHYRYPESNGDTVSVSLAKEFWIDRFKDGTYSKLRLHRISDCQFEIEFIESDNELRKNFSRPGDRYRYQVIDKTGKYYLLSVKIDGNDRIATFKMYR